MAIIRRIGNLFRRRQVDREIAAELEAHIALRTDDNIGHGMSPEEARRDALLRFGNPTATKERATAADAALALDSVIRDVRFALRQFRRSPGFTIVVISILAVGIGASTAIFSVVNPILFEPLPYPHANRIATIWDTYKTQRIETTFGGYRELAQRARSIESIAVFEPWQPVMTGADKPERPDGQRVSASYFRLLGVLPRLGRDFQEADGLFRGPRVVIVSDRLWRRRFGADRAIIGSQIKLNDDNYTVIGVMPQEFENVLSSSAEIWTPMQYDQGGLANFDSPAWGHHLRTVVRLRAGVSVGEARRELNQIANNPQKEFPRPVWASMSGGLIIDSLHADLVSSVKPSLLAVLGAVTLLLVIACVNVTSLMLARGAQRRGEFAMRAALGAARARLIRQSLTECTLLAMLRGRIGCRRGRDRCAGPDRAESAGVAARKRNRTRCPGFAFCVWIDRNCGVGRRSVSCNADPSFRIASWAAAGFANQFTSAAESTTRAGCWRGRGCTPVVGLRGPSVAQHGKTALD